jgi:hypothetical protein
VATSMAKDSQSSNSASLGACLGPTGGTSATEVECRKRRREVSTMLFGKTFRAPQIEQIHLTVVASQKGLI